VACLTAAPRLRLTTYYYGDSSLLTTYAYVELGQQLQPAWIADVSNIGDGQLNLAITSSAPWVSGTWVPDGGGACRGASPCIVATFDTASLAAGLHTAVLTVSDPNALDTPQTIPITLWVGPTVPDQVNLYALLGQSAAASFPVDADVFTAQCNADVGWLGCDVYYVGPPLISGWTWLDVGTSPDLDAGHHQGTLTLSNFLYSDDNKTVNVDFDVTNGPIADVFAVYPGFLGPPLTFTASLPTGRNAAQTQFYRVQNDGPGLLVISSIDISPGAAAWLSATPITVPGTANGLGIGAGVAITANPQLLPAGIYNGTVTVNSNAANSPVIPVELDVMAQGTPPAVIWPQILDIADYNTVVGAINPGATLAPGEIVALFGVGLLEGDPVTFSTPPLPTQAGSGNTQVLVNGRPAPIFYASYSQINFQIPFEASTTQDAQIQVVRNGMTSPTVTVPMAQDAPQILQFNCPFANDCYYQNYAIGTNAADGSFPLPASAPFPNSHPAKAGDVITFLGIGFGQTTNPLTTGAAAPSSPSPTTDPSYQLCFGYQPGDTSQDGVCAITIYSGAVPGAVGLYELKVTMPQIPNPGDAVDFYITNGTYHSDPAFMAVQQSSADSGAHPLLSLSMNTPARISPTPRNLYFVSGSLKKSFAQISVQR
jgi:uncharacterized protein (TIGR03437 family)